MNLFMKFKVKSSSYTYAISVFYFTITGFIGGGSCDIQILPQKKRFRSFGLSTLRNNVTIRFFEF